MEKERKIPVNVCLPIKFLDKVDEMRGSVPRSEYLRDFIMQKMKSMSAKSV